jgi:hypothetical protein
MNSDTLSRDLEALETLDGVLRWAYNQTPPAEFVDVIVQDEYTHDVIVAAGPKQYAVFDAT